MYTVSLTPAPIACMVVAHDPTNQPAPEAQMKTSDKAKFTAAWEAHIKQLTSLAFQSGCSTKEYDDTMATLRKWNKDGAEKLA